jgi:hypothetical protein
VAKKHITRNLNITGDDMIQLLNEDWAGDYQVIITYNTVHDLPETQTVEEKISGSS